MNITFILLLCLCYPCGIMGTKAQYENMHFGFQTQGATANRYGRWYVTLLIVLFISSLFVSVWSWWVELLVIVGSLPASFFVGAGFAYAMHGKTTNFRTKDGGTDVKKMADYYRKKKNVSEKLATNRQISYKDDLYSEVKGAVIREQKASTEFLQQQFKITYSRAAQLMDTLEEQEIIGPYVDSGERQVLLSNDNPR